MIIYGGCSKICYNDIIIFDLKYIKKIEITFGNSSKQKEKNLKLLLVILLPILEHIFIYMENKQMGYLTVYIS